MSQDARRITDYTIMKATKGIALSPGVMEMIQQGWQPFGRPFVYDDDNAEVVLAQAMVKYEIRQVRSPGPG